MSHPYFIPVVHSKVNVADLHPKLARRVHELCDLLTGLKVISGVRTYAQQKYLYDGYKSGRKGFNLAANPDRPWSSGEGKGSRHQAQLPHNLGYAVDVRKGPWDWEEIHHCLPRYGLAAPVRGEPWHLVANRRGSLNEWLEAPSLDKQGIEAEKPADLDLVAKVFPPLDLSSLESFRVVRRGHRGPWVKAIQQQLIRLGWLAVGEADGIFGRKTFQAVKRLQRAGIPAILVDGIVGPQTWKMMFEVKPQASLSLTAKRAAR